MIDLPRPRDINSIELAKFSTQITRALKGAISPLTAAQVSRMKRIALVALFFILLLRGVW